MTNSEIIKEAVSYHKSNSSFIKIALKYNRTPTYTEGFNIIWFWFQQLKDEESEDLKELMNFPATENQLSSWWSNFESECLRANRRFFSSIFNEKVDGRSSISDLVNVSVFRKPTQPRYRFQGIPDMDEDEVWYKINTNLYKIWRAIYAVKFGQIFPGDKYPPSFYEREFGLRDIKEIKREEGYDVELYEEIPPNLQNSFSAEKAKEVQHSFKYIREQTENFIKDTYFKRKAPYRRYDWALDNLLNRNTKGVFDYREFWKYIGKKYGKNSEVRKILLTDVEVVRQPGFTYAQSNIFVKTGSSNELEFNNNNSMDYSNLNKKKIYSYELPSKTVLAARNPSNPNDACCEIGFAPGTIVDMSNLQTRLHAIVRQYRKCDNPSDPNFLAIRDELTTIVNAIVFMRGYLTIHSNYAFNGPCPPMPVPLCPPTSNLPVPVPTIPVPAPIPTIPVPTSTPTIPIPTSTPPIPVPPPPPPPPTPAPSGSGRGATGKMKFYDLGFENYCHHVVNPREIRDLLTDLLNVIRNLELVDLIKQSRRARNVANVAGALDKAVGTAEGLAAGLIGQGKR